MGVTLAFVSKRISQLLFEEDSHQMAAIPHENV